MKSILIRSRKLTVEHPSMVVPIAEKTQEQIMAQARVLTEIAPDIIEWRVDYYEQSCDIHQILLLLRRIRSIIGDLPLIFTCRTVSEGGYSDYSAEYYRAMYQAAIESTLIDAVDIEIFAGDHQVRTLISLAHEEHVTVICSNHDSRRTPSCEELLSRIQRMHSLGADVMKIVVTAGELEDMVPLIQAISRARALHPNHLFVALSMGQIGVMTRLFPKEFGSCIAYSSVGNGSAPGQLPFVNLKQIWGNIEESGGRFFC